MKELITSIIIGTALIYMAIDLIFDKTKTLLKLVSTLLVLLIFSISILIFQIEKISKQIPDKDYYKADSIKHYKGEEN
ncbi:hypothetical protein SAMN06265182_0980 [Persephonella hydrogeniphila]|uniref:Uncharacterized protein n=1 Tax=Persephonella hydrogeniphila TaxID=198703 RepID=A0A285NFP2_9AQUI|nr:hypothetical protein [Persephonella hydrogeniphila]SNZ07713.1 hypothetical protein SAMN06265182_0980 [Persephonella hydrogeniphila]